MRVDIFMSVAFLCIYGSAACDEEYLLVRRRVMISDRIRSPMVTTKKGAALVAASPFSKQSDALPLSYIPIGGNDGGRTRILQIN